MTVQPPRNILIPIDNSEHSDYAFEWFLKYFLKDRDHVFMFHCLDPAKIPPPPPPALVLDESEMPETPEQAMENKMKTLISENRLKGKVIIVTSANPGEAIVQAVEKHKIDAIIMGTQGEGLNTRKTVGRVCDYVMENAIIPTVVCRLPLT